MNVLRVLNSRGAPSLPSETSLIENEVAKIADSYLFNPRYANEELIESIDVKGDYVNYIENIVDLDLIKGSGIKIVVDNLFGTSREYLDYILSERGIDIVSIHNFPHSSAAGISTPFEFQDLKDLSREVIDSGADVGLATDISGDRFAIVDAKGKYLPSNVIMPVLIEYLINVRKMEGGIVKSISTTDNIKKVADYYLRKVFVTPVGFKYLADMLSSRKAFIGIESTNGASINKTVKMKDGILFNLLVTEMMAYYKMDLDKILAKFYLKFPRLFCWEISLKGNARRIKNYTKLIQQKKHIFNDYPIRKIEYIDGIKFHFNDSWLLVRLSGTSDVIRIYAESPVLKKTKSLIKIGRSLIDGFKKGSISEIQRISACICDFFVYFIAHLLFWRQWYSRDP